MITRDEVQHIAKLARLDLTENEIDKFQKDLSAILDYFEKLKEIDVSDQLPMSHPVKVENVTREDEINEKLKNQNGKLLKLAPETKDGYLKVKAVF